MNSAEHRISELRAVERRAVAAHGRELVKSFQADLRQHPWRSMGVIALVGAGAYGVYRLRRKTADRRQLEKTLDKIRLQTAAAERDSRHNLSNSVKRAAWSWIVQGLVSPFLPRKGTSVE